MSFSCREHGWMHLFASCPICQQPQIISNQTMRMAEGQSLQAQLAASQAELADERRRGAVMREALVSIRDGYEHDRDTHKPENGACRLCIARDALARADRGAG